MAQISKTLEKDLKDSGGMTYILRNTMDYANKNILPQNADEITVYSYEDYVQFYSYKLPKNKIVDLEWVMNKWGKSTDSTFVSFTENFKQLLADKGYTNSINVYPTSYGIGIFVMFSAREQTTKIHQDVIDILTERNIEYRTGTSDAGWVFRFYISKSKENIERLKNESK